MEDLIVPLTIGFIIFTIWFYHFVRKKIDLLKKMREALKVRPLLENEITKLRQENRINKATINELELGIKEKDQHYSTLHTLNNTSIEKISELYSNFLTVQFDLSAKYLKTKSHPAIKEAKRISELRKETRGYIEKFKQIQYKYEALVSLFPELTNYIDDFTFIKELNIFKGVNEVIDSYDRVRDYIPKDEYEKLSEDERNQKALDNYNHREKTNWQIGRDYEMYCAYRYRIAGDDVEQTGIDKRFEDLGRDLITHRDNGDIYIIQCKYWASNKLIHEKHIAQLYGTSIMYKLEMMSLSTNKVIPVFITNIDISEILGLTFSKPTD